MSENTFVKKRHIWIFIVFILMLHIVIYVMTEVKFNGDIRNKPDALMNVYTRWTGISVRFRSLIGKLLVNGPKVAGHAADDKTKTKYSENEADISVIVDR